MNELIEAYISSTSLVQHQIDSFNKFVDMGLQQIIEEQKFITPNVESFALKLGKLRIDKPSVIEADSSRRYILPNEARLRNLTYAAPMFLEFIPVIKGIEKSASYGDVFIGELPVMLRSSLCNMNPLTRTQLMEGGEDADDPGGYFIIKGTERVLINLEDVAPNRIITTSEKGGSETVSKVFSTSSSFRARCVVRRNQNGSFAVSFPTVSKDMDMVMLLRALGLQMKDVVGAMEDIRVVKNDVLLNVELSAAKDLTPSEAMLELGKLSAPFQAKEYQQKRVETQIDTYLLPHVGTGADDRKEKGRYIIEMAKKASLVANRYIRQDDKDNYGNKRIKTAGRLMEELFAYAFRFFIKDVKYQIERTSVRGRKMSVQNIVSSDTLTEKILYAMGTGTWVAGQTGISQVLERTNMISTYAHLRRVKSPLTKKHPHFKAREVHGTQWGKICPIESPEGVEVGLTKYLAMMSRITTGANEKLTEEKLKEMGVNALQ